jgi:hypothetical protein
MYIAGLEDGKMMYDASIYKTVLARCPVLSVLADNPRASEFEHHLGVTRVGRHGLNMELLYCYKLHTVFHQGYN